MAGHICVLVSIDIVGVLCPRYSSAVCCCSVELRCVIYSGQHLYKYYTLTIVCLFAANEQTIVNVKYLYKCWPYSPTMLYQWTHETIVEGHATGSSRNLTKLMRKYFHSINK